VRPQGRKLRGRLYPGIDAGPPRRLLFQARVLIPIAAKDRAGL
jgi:hypothetical protein